MRAHGKVRAGLALTLLFAATATAADVDIGKDEWKLERTWKSAHEGDGGARYHFYSGEFAVINTSGSDLAKIEAKITLLDPNGAKINATDWISCGDLAAGKRVTRKYSLDRAVQFGELVLNVRYEKGGESKTVNFSSPDGSPPVCSEVTEGVNEVRVISYELDAPTLGDDKGKKYLIVRVRNLSASPANKVTAKVEFDTSKSAKKNSDKSSKKSKKSKSDDAEPAAEAVSSGKNTKVYEILLSEDPLAPGETKSFRKQLKALPEYNGFTVKLSAEWPDKIIETTAPAASGPTYNEIDGDGGKIKYGNFKSEKATDGTYTLSLVIVNNGNDLPADRFKLEFFFKDKDNQEIFKLSRVCAEALPQGQTMTVTIPGQKLPAYVSYEIAVSY